MAWVAAAIAGGAAINYLSSQNAASAQSDAASAANQTQRDQYNQTRQDNMPWMQAGSQAINQLSTQLPSLTRNFTAGDFQTDPGYQFALNQGLQAIQRSAAAKGTLNSVGTMQNLNNYAQGIAAQQYQNAYDRFTGNQQRRYNMLAGVAGAGQQGVGMINGAGQNAANNIANNQTGVGNSQAAMSIAQGNNLSGMLTNGANSWMNYQMMNNLMGNQPPNTSSPY